MRSLRHAVLRALYRLGYEVRKVGTLPPFPQDFDAETRRICEAVAPFTMTSRARVAALIEAVRYIERQNIAGSFVECGVWRGGSSMAMAMACTKPRDIYLYDTFSGMPPPTDADGAKADSAPRCLATEDEVKANLAGLRSRFHLIAGKVEDTIPTTDPGPIALLRLDTDWYESTRHELRHFFPRLSGGGVLIVDDYGYWDGARKAVDEYFAGSPHFLHRIDDTGRLLVKH